MPPSADATLPSATLPLGRPHSIAEDFYALVIGCILLVIGMVFLKAAGLVTGGIAGIALLLSYLVPLPTGVLFTLINLPFFLFAHYAMGRRFAIKTMLVNAGLPPSRPSRAGRCTSTRCTRSSPRSSAAR
jgi:hypothetical protein